LKELHARHESVCVVRLRRNFGQTAAKVAGFDRASGETIVCLDGERRLPSQMANWLISWTTGTHLHDYGCTLKAYWAEVVKELRLYGEMHRFIPALIGGWRAVSDRG
jgi:hypothetical protein